MPKRFYKFRLLLDENMHSRQLFPRLNNHFDIKHITLDFKKSGISDKTGITALSVNLSDDQIDKKLTAFLIKNKQNDIFGKFVSITGET